MNWKDILKSEVSKAPFGPFKKKPLDMAAQQEQNRMADYQQGVDAFDKLMADKKLFKMIEKELRNQMSVTPNNINYSIDLVALPNFTAKYAPIFERVFKRVEDRELNEKKFLEDLAARFGVWEVTMQYARYLNFKVNQ